MEDQPDSNPSQDSNDPERLRPGRGVGGDQYVVYGDVRAGGVVGSGSVTGQNFGETITIHQDSGGDGGDPAVEFTNLLSELRELISRAKEAGELTPDVAEQIIDNLGAAEKIAKQADDRPKGAVAKRLETVADMIDAAVDTFAGQSGQMARMLLSALPVVALLVKLAVRYF
ncbi:MAG: hypothetical protein GYB68_18085 [Chloroflexi bacterium]|nr:hypothetical protein [Chloroflexota bacterium]